jgi:GDP/UDP-N,N'-diacetylbacillosamine 2-epimerase (hydrolysing)
MIRVGVLTSSRADYGIYLPLIKNLLLETEINLKIVVFGTHLSKYHGYTVDQIEQDGFSIFAKIESMLVGDSPNAIASAYALTGLKFADFWSDNHEQFDIVFALGDRYEMAAAVAASIPFGVDIAHIHGGETTLGAIDNIYRHSITLASKFHFAAAELFANRIKNLLDHNQYHVYHVGSLGIENLMGLTLLTLEEFSAKWGIDLNQPTLLLTVHPETSDYAQNERHCQELEQAIRVLVRDFQLVITMPNADTSGLIFRKRFERLSNEFEAIRTIENFGSQSYFTCMNYVQLVLGNSSSGIIEAGSMRKYALNLGNRQLGRLSGENVIHREFEMDAIVQGVMQYSGREYTGENPYYRPHASKNIIEILKKHYGKL